MTETNDSTPIREGEELNTNELDHYLRANLPAEYFNENASLEIRQFPGGHSNLTYLVRVGSCEFVLRRPPVGPVAPTAHDMPREFRLLSVIHPLFPLAPKPVVLCEDESILGVPFYLMERRRGFIIRSQTPDALADYGQRRTLSENIVDTLISLHGVDIHSTGIIELGKPQGFVTRQVNGWANRWQRAKTNELPEMEDVIDWLRVRIPPEALGDATIVHNDFKLDNIMLDVKEPTKVVALLDWEMCAVGDPLIDLGLFLSYWTMKGGGQENKSLQAITNGEGWLRREEIIDRYQKATGRNLSNIVFYETFARFKVAVVIQQIYFRYVKGQTHDQRFQHFDVLVRDLTTDALKLAMSAQL